MKDKIIVYSPLYGCEAGYLLWEENNLAREYSYHWHDNGSFYWTENFLLYVAGLIKSANAARRRQNQK